MEADKINPDVGLVGDLLATALATLRDEILPGRPGEKRYTGAMVANALGMAERRLCSPDPGAALVQKLGGRSLDDVARAIRSGEISETSHARLAADLFDYIFAELAITNPRFLKRREE